MSCFPLAPTDNVSGWESNNATHVPLPCVILLRPDETLQNRSTQRQSDLGFQDFDRAQYFAGSIFGTAAVRCLLQFIVREKTVGVEHAEAMSSTAMV